MIEPDSIQPSGQQHTISFFANLLVDPRKPNSYNIWGPTCITRFTAHPILFQKTLKKLTSYHPLPSLFIRFSHILSCQCRSHHISSSHASYKWYFFYYHNFLPCILMALFFFITLEISVESTCSAALLLLICVGRHGRVLVLHD